MAKDKDKKAEEKNTDSPGQKDKAAKIAYLLLLLIAFIAAIVLRLYGADLVVSFGSFSLGCTGSTDVTSRCLGIQAVYRVSLGSAIFFFLMAIVTCCAPAFHRGYWVLKLIFYFGLVVLMFLIPNDGMLVYGNIATIVSGIFLFLQVVILIDFAYAWNEDWLDKIREHDENVEKGKEGGRCSGAYKTLYIVFGFGMMLAGIISVIVMYAFYPQTCPLNVASLTITWVTGIGYTIFCLQEKVGKGLLTPAAVFLYCVFLNWGAISANPDAACNPSVETPTDEIIAIVIACFSLLYTVFSSSNSVFYLFKGGDKATIEKNDEEMEEKKKKVLDQILTTDQVKTGEKDKDVEKGVLSVEKVSPTKKEETNEEPIEVAIWFFHFIVCIGSIYMSMLLSNWGTVNNTTISNRSSVSMWVKVVSEWITIAIFIWTCIAPVMMPSRDFSHNIRT